MGKFVKGDVGGPMLHIPQLGLSVQAPRHHACE